MKQSTKRKLIVFGYLFSLVALFVGGIFLFKTNDMQDGKLNIDLVIRKEKVEEHVDNLEEFKTYFEPYINELNATSGDTDYFETSNYSEQSSTYTVTVHTRRVDKLKGLGDIRYGLSENFFEHNTNNVDLIDEIYEGKIRQNLSRTYQDGSKKLFKFSATDRLMNKYSVQLKENDQFIEKEEAFNRISQGGGHVIAFQLIDLKLVDEIKFNVHGNIRFVSTLKTPTGDINNIKQDGKTITISPVKCYASVDNVQVETNLFIGYFAYTQYISPVLLSLFICLGILLLTILYFGIFRGYFRKIFSKKTLKKLWKYRSLLCILVPALFLLFVFRYMPMAWLTAGFMDYDLLEGLNSEWVGLKYFERIFLAKNTAEMYRIFRNTIFISVIRIVSNLPFILFLALIINSMKRKRAKTIFQSITLVPYFLSWVAVGGLFYSLLNSESGLINRFLGLTIDWYHISEPWWCILSVSSLWKGMGWAAIIYIAAMCQIDPEQYEAARIDGCGPLRQALTVTIPGIMGVICLQLILDTANIMRDNYDQILAMINGQTIGIIQQTTDVVGRISYTSLRDGNFGSATAIGLIQGVIGTALVVLTNKIVKKTDNEGIM